MNVPNSLAGLKILLLLLLLNLNSLKSFASPTKIAKNWDVPEDPGYGTINYYSQLLCQNQTESFSYALNTCFVTSQGQSVLYSCGSGSLQENQYSDSDTCDGNSTIYTYPKSCEDSKNFGSCNTNVTEIYSNLNGSYTLYSYFSSPSCSTNPVQILGWRNNVCFGSSTSTSNSSFFYNYTYEYKWESSLSCAGSASSFDVHYGICVSISEEGVYSYSEIIQYYNDKEIVNTDDDTISVTHYSKGTYILSIGAIIGIVIGSIAFFGLSAFCYFSRNNSRNNFIKRKWEVFHQNLRQNFPLNPFFEKFLKDYWLEMKIYDPIIALLSDWYIFEPPSNQSDFQRRPIIRVYYVIVSIILTAGIASLFNCTFFNKPSQELALFLTLLVVTIPSEIYNFIWFKWVVDHDTLLTKLETKEKTEKMYWYCRQSTGSIAGIFCGLLLGGFSLYIYIITSTYHFTCSEYHRRNIMIDAIMLKLFINPLFMSLPYWRKQGFILLFLGQAGPIIGLLLHYRQYGCKPISTSNINRNHSNLKMVESPFHKDNQSSGSVTKEVEVVTFPNGIIGQEKMNSTTLSMDCIRKLPAFLDETLRLKGLIHYVSPISSKEKIIFEVYENEKFHPVYKNWGQAYGVYLDPSTDHPAYTYVNIILIDRREHRHQPDLILPIDGYGWQNDWIPVIQSGSTDENGYQYARTWDEFNELIVPLPSINDCNCRRRLLRRSMVPLNEKILPSEPYSIEIRLKCATSLPGYETNYFRNHFHVEVFKNQIFIGKTCSSKPKWNTLFTIPIHTLDDHIRFSFCFWMKKIFQLPSTEHSSLVNKHSAKSMESSTSTTIVTHGSAQPLRISRKDNKFSASFAIYPFRREPTTEGNHALTPSAYQLLGTADIEISEIIFKGFDKLPEFTLPLHLPDSSNSNHCVTSGSITLNCKIERNQDEI